MPNHVHLTVQPYAGNDPSEVLHSWKGFAAREINKHLGRSGPVWEQESYDTLVRDVAHLWKILRYIGKNPSKANIPEDQGIRWVHPLWEKAGFGFGTGG
jgi:REP element-mobilizing transposase RayT